MCENMSKEMTFSLKKEKIKYKYNLLYVQPHTKIVTGSGSNIPLPF